LLARATESAPIATTVCAITQRPGSFQRKLVSFPAQFISDTIEHSALIDPWCKRGIGPYIPDSAIGAKEFDKALYNTGFFGMRDKTITATWVGRVTWHPKQIPRLDIVVSEIRDLKVDFVSPPPDMPPPDVHLPDPPLPVWPPKQATFE